MFALQPDYERIRQRIEAFWEREVLDRPVVQFGLLKPPAERVELPISRHAVSEDRWLDVEYQARYALANLSNHEYLGDTLPIAYPNLGPEVFSSFYGCPIHFGDFGTSWTDPILENWEHADALRLDWRHPMMRKLEEMTDALLEVGKDRFIVGMTDWHPGGDAIAAFRDPQNLAIDMIVHRDEVMALLKRLEADYFAVYDHFYYKLRNAGQPITTWTALVADGKYYVPSNDFSIMISKTMFDEVFLPGIVNECRFLDRSIYHLDGPGALRHLDSLLAIPELDALQWVFGAGNEGFHRWVWVYQRAQAAGKGVQVICTFDEIDAIMEARSPRGLFLSVSEVPSREAGLDMLARLERWTARKVKS